MRRDGYGNTDTDPAVGAFLDEIEAVCRKHGMSLGHEDSHGAFIVYTNVDETIIKWLKEASVSKESA